MSVICGKCQTEFNKLPDKVLDLVIADPPYFRVLKAAKWDRFKTLSDYLSFSEEWIRVVCSKLRLSGTFLLYGCCVNMDIMSELNRVLVANGLEFIQEIVINKGIKAQAGRLSDKIKMLPPVSENIFVYRKDAKPFVKKLLRDKAKESGLSVKEIKERLGIPANGGANWTKWVGDTQFPLLPTCDNWEKICKVFSIGDIPYSMIEETYNGVVGFTNVWSDIDFNIKNRIHPAQKPDILSERLISLFSNENDYVGIPFAGSGSEVLACARLRRRCFATEKDSSMVEKYIDEK